MISPAIHLPGTCGEAIRLYAEAFHATDIHIDYYRDAPPGSGMAITEDTKDLVMHATVVLCGTPVNFSDSTDPLSAGNMICLNVFLDGADQVRHAYDTLKEGGKVVVEPGPQFFSPMYGSVEDRYGIKWQLIS